MRSVWLACIILLACATAAVAQDSPAGVVEAHFAAIAAENYVGADAYFSAAFLRAFKADVSRLNEYYRTRREQISLGYQFLEPRTLDDEGKDTASVVVEFGDPRTDAIVTVTERMYYYLVRERAPPSSPGAGRDGYAWRIDIFDALAFESLADARRRPYLYTREAWPEDSGRELKSRQGLFRLQWALDAYFRDRGQYPFRLLGGKDRRDELISGGYLTGAYPPCGFADRPMRAVEFAERSSGDLSYYSVDADGDGRRESYWLLLHGKVKEHYYFERKDTVYILSAEVGSQAELAEGFARYWFSRMGKELEITGAVFPSEPQGGLVPSLQQAGQAGLAELESVEEMGEADSDEPAMPGEPASTVELIEPITPVPGAVVPVADDGDINAVASWARAVAMASLVAGSLSNRASELAFDEPVRIPLPAPGEMLKVFSYGFE
ncbi:hypothetical protein IIA79_02590 [bacterium]|nr:hypothetical protein [bacterium]